MNKNDYLITLNSYCNTNGISVYDYYYQYGEKLKKGLKSACAPWELACPFLTDDDYQRLLTSTDDQICEYFALAMEKVISLNKIEPSISKETFNEKNDEIFKENRREYSDVEKNDEIFTENSKYYDNEKKVEKEDSILSEDNDDTLLLDNKDEPILLKDASNHLLLEDHQEPLKAIEGADIKLLTRGDIEDVINSQMNQDSLSREDIEGVVNEQMNGLNGSLSREDIEGVVNEQIDGLNGSLSREDIEEIINSQMNHDTLSREDISDVIDDELNQTSSIKNFFVKIGKGIANLLNGFAIFKNAGNKETDIYYYDGENNQLGDKVTVSPDSLAVDSGIYVNYQEYLDHLLESVFDRYPDADKYSFINEEHEEKSFPELTEEAFAILKEAGAIRFGKDVVAGNPHSYEELVQLNADSDAEFVGKKMKQGVYVRRDMLDDIFTKFQVRAFYNQNQEENSREYVK